MPNLRQTFTPKLNTMLEELLGNLNWLHLLVAAIAYFAVGALWYSPVLFSNAWANAVGLKTDDPELKKTFPIALLGSFLMMCLTVVALGIIQQKIPAVGISGAMKVGLFFGLCFSAMGIGISYIYQRKPLVLYLIDCGYHIVGCCIASIIIVLWP